MPDRLCGEIKNLTRQLGGSWNLFQYINTLTYHFDMFCCMAGRIGDNMMLDESCLSHSVIQNAVKQYLSVGDAQKNAYVHQYGEAVAERRKLYAGK